MSDRVLVVGGGLIGAMCAWYLTDAGFSVTIVDRERYGAACSDGNSGYVCPSHVLPLCQPGAVQKTMRTLLQRNSPFAIKPRLSRHFASWFWKFMRQCNERQMWQTADATHSLLQASMGLYRELLTTENIECEWQERGLLFVYDHAREFEAFAKTESAIRERFGLRGIPLDGQQLVELEPAIKPGFGGAWHYPDDCHLRADKLSAALRQRMEARGVTVLENTPVTGIAAENGRARAAQTKTGDLEADHFVVATGAMTPFLGKHLGFRVPIEPGKGYSITMSAPQNMPRHPMIFEDSHVAVTPLGKSYRIGSTMEFVGYDTSIHQRRLSLLTEAAKKYLHDPLGETIESTWFGWRPLTFDGKPIIDKSPALENVTIAAGHGMLGISGATGTGLLVRNFLAGEKPHIDPTPFSASRFL